MAAETGYQAQVAPSAGPGPVLTSATARGAGVAQALEGAGDIVHASQLRAYQVQREQDRQAQSADFYHRLATIQTSNDALVDQLRSNAEPGGVGHVEQVRAALDKQAQDLFGGITEQAVMTAAREQWDSYSNGVVRSAQDWAEGQRIGKTIGDNLTAGNVIVGRVRTSADPQAFRQATDLLQGMAARMQVPPDVRDKFLRQGMQDLALADLANKRDRDPVTAQQALESGAYDDVLSPQVREHVVNENRVALAARDNALRTQAAMAKRDVGQSVDLFIKQINDGLVVPDDQAAAVERRATEAGLPPTKIYELQDVRALNKVKTEYRNASPELIAGDLQQLDTRIAKAGGEATSDMIQRRNHMAAVLEQRRQEIASDQAGWAARNGISAPQVDWANPTAAVIDQRVKAIDAAAVSGGIPPEARQYFSAEDVAHFKSGLGSKNGVLTAVAAAQHFGGWRAGVALGQLKPNDANLPYLATLPLDTVGTIWDGQEHLKQFHEALTPPKERKSDWNRQFDRQDARINAALRLLDVKQRGAFWNAARNTLGGLIAHGEPLSPGLRWKAINIAMGMTGDLGNGQRGGFARWDGPDDQGHGVTFMLPRGMTAREFQRAAIGQAAQNGPVNPDGTPAAISRAHPLATGPGLYRFDSPEGLPLRRRDHSIFTVKVGP